MKSTWQPSVFLIGILLLSALAVLAFDETQFRFWKPATPDQVDKKTVVGMIMDDDIYEESRDDFADLRLLNNDRIEQPYVIEPRLMIKARLVSRACANQLLSVTTLTDNRLEIIARLMDNDCHPDELIITSPMKDFTCQVAVWSSDDQRSWTPLITNAPIFDYSRFVDFRKLNVPLPANRSRFLRIILDNITDVTSAPFMEIGQERHQGAATSDTSKTTLIRRNFRIDKLTLNSAAHEVPDTTPRLVEYSVSSFTVTHDPKTRQTQMMVTTRRQPLTQFLLVTDDTNFSRQIRVDIPVDNLPGKEWVTVGNAVISRIELGTLHHEQILVEIRESRQATYRLTIENQDNPPLNITAIKTQGPSYRVVFITAPEEQYRLYFGANHLQAPAYDLGQILPGQPATTDVIEFTPGKALALNSADAPRFIRRLLNDKRSLAVILILMVVIVCVGIFRAVKKVDAMPED